MAFRRKILLVCRDPSVMLDVFDQLGAYDYEVFATPNPRSAIHQAYDLQPDAVLMAVAHLPAGEWTATLRTLRGLSRMPIIALVGPGSEADRQLAVEAGVDACSMQPFDGSAVAAKLDDLAWPGRAPGHGALQTAR